MSGILGIRPRGGGRLLIWPARRNLARARRYLEGTCAALLLIGPALGALPAGAPAASGKLDPVRVVAASDLQYALRDIAAAFQAAHPGISVQLSFGSSGRFFTQLTQGLAADLFFSADARFPERLEQAGLVEPGTRRLYAVGRLVIWVRDDFLASPIPSVDAPPASASMPPPRPTAPAPGPALLTRPDIVRLAIANPVHAPYGRAALTLLEHYGLARRKAELQWERMQGNLEAYFDFGPLRAGKPHFELVLGENISHTAQLALSGTGTGILALSIARAQALETAGRYWLAPLDSHLKLEQAYAVLRGRARPEVMAFYQFVASRPARDIFRRYGFLLPDEGAEGEAGLP